tara:strand:+ start:395 stop:1255 length:861 start_codon:yes stop_codon:yes gene_type:complete
MSNPEALYYEGRCNALEDIITQLREEYKREHNANIALSTRMQEMSEYYQQIQEIDKVNKPRVELLDEFFSDIKPLWEQVHAGGTMLMETLLDELYSAYDDYVKKVQYNNSIEVRLLFDKMLDPNVKQCNAAFIRRWFKQVWPLWKSILNMDNSAPAMCTKDEIAQGNIRQKLYKQWFDWWQTKKYIDLIISLFQDMPEPVTVEDYPDDIKAWLTKIIRHWPEILKRDPKRAPRAPEGPISHTEQKKYYKEWYKWWEEFQEQLSEPQVELKETEPSIQTITTRIRAL